MLLNYKSLAVLLYLTCNISANIAIGTNKDRTRNKSLLSTYIIPSKTKSDFADNLNSNETALSGLLSRDAERGILAFGN